MFFATDALSQIDRLRQRTPHSAAMYFSIKNSFKLQRVALRSNQKWISLQLIVIKF